MSALELSPAAQRLYDEFAPLAKAYDEENDFALAYLCQFFGRLVEPLWRLAFAADAPWAVALDPDTATLEELQWWGQDVGVVVPDGTPIEEARARVKRAAGRRRGTSDFLIESVQATLTGDRRVTVVERYQGSAWHELIVTYASETPNPAKTAAAIRADKIVGVRQTIRVDPGWSIGQMEAAYAGLTIADLEADFESIGALESNLPT